MDHHGLLPSTTARSSDFVSSTKWTFCVVINFINSASSSLYPLVSSAYQPSKWHLMVSLWPLQEWIGMVSRSADVAEWLQICTAYINASPQYHRSILAECSMHLTILK